MRARLEHTQKGPATANNSETERMIVGRSVDETPKSG
jgi:hypothetical protein